MGEYGTVAIIGVGLIGGSIGLALKRRELAERVIGVGHRKESLNLALKKGAIDEASLDAEKAVPPADIVIMATPISLIIELSREIVPHLKKGAILTDVGSTKNKIIHEVEDFMRRDIYFIGGHPIAGSEKRGVAEARADLFEGTICVLTPSENAASDKVNHLKELWRALGSRVMVMSAEEHDRVLAYVSHLPHLAAWALMAGLQESFRAFAGSGFRDSTRIAASDPKVWGDIFLSNRDEILQSLQSFEAQLERMRDLIASGDVEALRQELESVVKKRKEIEAAFTRGANKE